MGYKKSIAAHERAKKIIPGGINSNVRAVSEPVPLHIERAKGSRIWDVDGNEYIDYLLGHGPMILGHTPAPVVQALQRQVERGIVYGLQSELEVRAAELVCTHVPCAEMVRFSTTGSEAVHAALRLARACTGRKKVLRFEGHYHGWFDNIAWNQASPAAQLGPREDPPLRPASEGQQPEDGANLVVLPWNDTALLEDLFARRGEELAAVICDPFASAAGLIPGQPNFLKTMRRLCSEHDVLLIFDEVITGFRVGLGGAQGYFGVTPDLATFAKALGAGMPVSAVAGKAKYMERFGTLKTVHAGTYNSNPLAMAGTVAALEAMSADDGAILKKANAKGDQLSIKLSEIADDFELPITLRGVGTVFSATFLPPDADPVTDYRSARRTNYELGRKLWIALQNRGVQITSMGIWFVSTAHTDEDIKKTLKAAEAALHELRGSKR
ncbi:MAG: aspartate aminotransferase family protein [Candidatus Hydrogenedentes bacterium]|nr:aspartate aminotransferase family protein [Candidatus Hydrogenedentota bacterium]